MKIPVHYYVDVETLTFGEIQDYVAKHKCFVKNAGGNTYLVEII